MTEPTKTADKAPQPDCRTCKHAIPSTGRRTIAWICTGGQCVHGDVYQPAKTLQLWRKE